MDGLTVEERLDEIARLLAFLCKRLGPDGESLQEFVAGLGGVGLRPARIAQLAGTTPNYANVALNRARQKKR
jgi:hypothetical protein